MKAIDIISKLPHKTFESQAAYWERNKTVLGAVYRFAVVITDFGIAIITGGRHRPQI